MLYFFYGFIFSVINFISSIILLNCYRSNETLEFIFAFLSVMFLASIVVCLISFFVIMTEYGLNDFNRSRCTLSPFFSKIPCLCFIHFYEKFGEREACIFCTKIRRPIVDKEKLLDEMKENKRKLAARKLVKKPEMFAEFI